MAVEGGSGEAHDEYSDADWSAYDEYFEKQGECLFCNFSNCESETLLTCFLIMYETDATHSKNTPQHVLNPPHPVSTPLSTPNLSPDQPTGELADTATRESLCAITLHEIRTRRTSF